MAPIARRQGEDDVIIGCRQEFDLALGQPLPRRRTCDWRRDRAHWQEQQDIGDDGRLTFQQLLLQTRAYLPRFLRRPRFSRTRQYFDTPVRLTVTRPAMLSHRRFTGP
jgi:hypothetical protein